jgi:hypothetical protein
LGLPLLLQQTPQLLLRCLFCLTYADDAEDTSAAAEVFVCNLLGEMEGETIMGEKACIFSRILHTDASAAAL